VKIFSVTEKIFWIMEKIFWVTEKIFSKAERIFPVSETMVFGIQKIFSVIEAIFSVVETTVSATESIFSEVEKIFVASDNIFFTMKIIFSVTEKTVREAPAVFWPQQRMNSNKQPARRLTMAPQIRVADGLQSAERLITTAGAIINGLTGNPSFSSPPVDLKTVQAAVDDLNAALAAQPHGGTAATAEKKNKQEALIGLLRRLRHYVEDHCGNDLSVLLSSGFQAAVTTRVRSPLANPSILNVDFGNSTELVLRVTPIAHAKCYEVRSAAVCEGNTPGPWQTAGLFTNSRSMTINGLTPGTTYMFQVRAVGGSTRYSDWSNPVSRMCV
jgi:hypothetical protein